MFKMLLELLLFMVAAPSILILLPARALFIPVLWFSSAIILWHFKSQQIPWKEIWRWSAVSRSELQRIFIRFIPIAILVTLGTQIFHPELILTFYRLHFLLWLIVMILYPLVSVVPQEIICRAFMYSKYKDVVGGTLGWVLASALLFGTAHIFLGNPVAPVMSFIGGILFANTYARTRSLALVSIEHALYGDMLFTVGLGQYFYHAAAH
jgi:hypothetical protein